MNKPTDMETEKEKAEMNEFMAQEEQEVIEARQQIKKPKLKWIPLESNPDVSTAFDIILFTE